MPRFFTEDFREGNSFAVISGEDAVHISKSLRMREGDPITLCNKKSTDFFGTVQSIDGKQVVVEITGSCPSASEPTVQVSLFQALPKGDKMDWIVQKSVELGVFQICPVITKRCISRPEKTAWERKRERFQKISYEAAKQCGRGIVPEMGELLTLEEAFQRMSCCDLPILFYEQSSRPFAPILNCKWKSAAVLVGSEGGFEPEEAEQAVQAGITDASLGSRILRCETAPLAVLSALMFQSGNL